MQRQAWPQPSVAGAASSGYVRPKAKTIMAEKKQPTRSAAAPGKTAGGGSAVELERGSFRQLLAGNPNYFGTIAGSKFKAVLPMSGNTTYEELDCVAYNGAFDRLEATLAQKLTGGYNGGLCTPGSHEYVRFYVDSGSGWQDVGIAAAQVHDIPAGQDCANQSRHPLIHTVAVPFDPQKYSCRKPQLPRVRAILSWNFAPPANQPNWVPVWGNVHECAVQIEKSWTIFGLVDTLTTLIGPKLDPDLLEQIEAAKQLPIPQPLPDPPPLDVAVLAARYGYSGRPPKGQAPVEASRFGFAQAARLKALPASSDAEYEQLAKGFIDLGIDIGDLIGQIEDTTGNINYEEVDCIGLDNNTESLVATYTIKRPFGYSGDLCSAGSYEYVAFWADFDDDCNWTYLGTVKTKAYDFGSDLPSGGLCYAAVLPVDLSKYRKWCTTPVIGKVRAVLSWNSLPSPIDPDDVPYWGNRLDAHVIVKPGTPFPGTVTPNLTVVGGIHVNDIDDVSGLTLSAAKFVDTGFDADGLGRQCPFGGRVVIRGLQFTGYRYRVQVREFPGGVWSTLVKPIWVQPVFGPGFYHSPASDGYFNYLSFFSNFAGILAYFDTTDDERYEIRLDIDGVPGFASQIVQLDNTAPVADIQITSGSGTCGTFNPGDMMSGTFVARDLYFGRYSLVVKGHPSANTPTPSSGTIQTPITGSNWTLDTTGMAVCGYIIEVHAYDRAIVHSQSNSHHTPASVGFCLKNP